MGFPRTQISTVNYLESRGPPPAWSWLQFMSRSTWGHVCLKTRVAPTLFLLSDCFLFQFFSRPLTTQINKPSEIHFFLFFEIELFYYLRCEPQNRIKSNPSLSSLSGFEIVFFNYYLKSLCRFLILWFKWTFNQEIDYFRYLFIAWMPIQVELWTTASRVNPKNNNVLVYWTDGISLAIL